MISTTCKKCLLSCVAYVCITSSVAKLAIILIISVKEGNLIAKITKLESMIRLKGNLESFSQYGDCLVDLITNSKNPLDFRHRLVFDSPINNGRNSRERDQN